MRMSTNCQHDLKMANSCPRTRILNIKHCHQFITFDYFLHLFGISIKTNWPHMKEHLTTKGSNSTINILPKQKVYGSKWEQGEVHYHHKIQSAKADCSQTKTQDEPEKKTLGRTRGENVWNEGTRANTTNWQRQEQNTGLYILTAKQGYKTQV